MQFHTFERDICNLKRALLTIFFVSVLCCISVWSGSVKGYSEKVSIIVPQEVFLQPGDTSIRYFGDLKIKLMLSETGSYVDCELYVSTQLLGVQTLTADHNKYRFDLQLANNFAKGRLMITLQESPQVSKVSGNFTYSVASNNESFTFKGDLIAWYIDKY